MEYCITHAEWQDLESRGSPAEDVRVLRALWDIFNDFSQPRESPALTAEPPAEGSAHGSDVAGTSDDGARCSNLNIVSGSQWDGGWARTAFLLLWWPDHCQANIKNRQSGTQKILN